MSETRLVSTNAAAAAIGVSRSTLWRWLNDGLVTPAVRMPGKHMRWDIDDLRAQVSRLGPQAQEERTVPDPAAQPEHQPVVAAIVTSHLGVLITRRHDGSPPWGFVSGEIEPGESQTDAAIREVKEETGLLVRAGYQEIGRRVHPRTNRLMVYLACTPTHGTDVHVGDTEELAEVRWVPTLTDLYALIKREHIFAPVLEHLGRLIP
jgi:8-oxo-dGTP diphosphatase